jgi:V/A-type H+-transporting ATPase subunit A
MKTTLSILDREHELEQVVQLIGQAALSDMERQILLTSRILREDLLQQSSILSNDAFCSLEKSYWMMKAILHFHTSAQNAIQTGIDLETIKSAAVLQKIARMKELPLDEFARMSDTRESINA